ncbi:hypothetical protein ACS0PU_000299 [Formica fusca]
MRNRGENSLIPPYKNFAPPCRRGCRGGLAGNDTSADIFAMLAGNVVENWFLSQVHVTHPDDKCSSCALIVPLPGCLHESKVDRTLCKTMIDIKV